MVRVKRIYETPTADDGYRVLVDRLWPRGLTRDKAAIDLWAKDIAPSHELRKWFSHDSALWEEFRRRYRHELDTLPAARRSLDLLRQVARRQSVTLLHAAATITTNHALVIEDVLNNQKRARRSKV
jgi:uncharacterized protein YeaO (DUF488 family)